MIVQRIRIDGLAEEVVGVEWQVERVVSRRRCFASHVSRLLAGTVMLMQWLTITMFRNASTESVVILIYWC